MLKKFARWLWLKLTDEDPIVVSRLLSTYESLNECHVGFIEQLEKEHPELKSMIKKHREERTKLC